MSRTKVIKVFSASIGGVKISGIDPSKRRKEIAKEASTDQASPFFGMNIEKATPLELFLAVKKHSQKKMH